MRSCNRLKHDLKRDYVQSSLNHHRDNPRKLWKCIQNFWPSNKSATNFSGMGGNLRNMDKAELLNEHFTSVASKLSETLPEVDLDALRLLPLCLKVAQVKTMVIISLFQFCPLSLNNLKGVFIYNVINI